PEKNFRQRIFLFSPVALHPFGGNYMAAGPCAAVPQSIRNIAIWFCQRVSVCFLEGDDNPSGTTGQFPLHKGAFFHSHQRVFLVSAGNCMLDKPSNFRHWVQG
ncbi:MAG: hypothetical protein IJN44_11845, partial [Clostridia bacterium]|nr:hypothetical protein [Clostridia bacterium]